MEEDYETQLDMQGQIVQTETAGLHEMKIYNQLRDNIWSFADIMRQAKDSETILRNALQIQTLLQRAHGLWMEIDAAFKLKYEKLRIKGQSIYNGELLGVISQIDRYIKYLRYINKNQVDEDLLHDNEFEKLHGYQEEERIYALKEKIISAVEEAEKIWGTSAVLAGLNLPISAKEERSPFFRYRRQATNSYKRW